jgi:hypothetical protein
MRGNSHVRFLEGLGTRKGPWPTRRRTSAAMLNSIDRRIAVLGTSATLATAGTGFLFLPVPRWIGGGLLVAAAILVLLTYIGSNKLLPPRSFRIVTYKHGPSRIKQFPCATELRLAPKRPIPRPQFHITCDQPIPHAVAGLERLDVATNEVVAYFAIPTAVSGNTATFEFSEPQLAPPDFVVAELRSTTPLQVTRIACRRNTAAPHARARDIMGG